MDRRGWQMRVEIEDVSMVATLAELCPHPLVELVFTDGRVAGVRGPHVESGVVAASMLRLAARQHREGVDEAAWFGLVDHLRLGGPAVSQPADGVFVWRDSGTVAAIATGLDAPTVAGLFAQAVVPGIEAGALDGAVIADGDASAVLRIRARHPAVSDQQIGAVGVWAASVCDAVRRFRACDTFAWSGEGR